MPTHRSDAGFSLAALIFFATAFSIVMAAAVPAYQMQARRERELELIFRGEEYTRAIQKYQRKFGVYPTSVDQLVSTNNLRFIRRPYKDPVTGKEFRLITIDANGSVNGSKLFGQNMTNQPLFGNTQVFGGPTGGANTNTNNNNRPPGSSGGTPGISTNPVTGIGGNSGGGFGASTPARPGGNTSAPGNSGFGTSGNFGGNAGTTRPGTAGPGQATNSPFGTPGSGSGVFASGGIIGVASDSDKESIIVYNTRQKYDEWEFLAILGQNSLNGANPGGNPANGNPGGNNPGANPFGNNPPGGNPFGNNPFGNSPSGTNPFGNNPPRAPNQGNPGNPFPNTGPFGGPGGSPAGPGRGTPPVQQPFGFGNPSPQQPGR